MRRGCSAGDTTARRRARRGPHAARAPRTRIAAAILGWVVAWALAFPAFADETAGVPTTDPGSPLASRLSPAETAGEYWDVTAWFDSGECFFARFLVTNQGPGVRSAAAVGHFVRADRETVVPFKWGRRDGDWTLAADGRRVSIGKASLDVSGRTFAVRIDSKKHGIDLRLEIDGAANVRAFRSDYPAGTFAVAMPAPARAILNADDPSTTRTIVGSAAIVHRWGDRPETETISRRDEIYARRSDVALYVTTATSFEGTRRTTYALRRGDRDESSTSVPVGLDFGTGLMPGSDDGYPIARTWSTSLVAERTLTATLDSVLLRMSPLDVLPQPFRFILALGGTPQRVWADAKVRLTRGDDVVELNGVTATSFARPVR